jgi:endo-alpha-1,4-polygalactosaminidase (GH114 family)
VRHTGPKPLVDDRYVSSLASQGKLVFGYISISTVGGWEPWAKFVTRDMVVGYDRVWKEEIINVCSPQWHSIILEKALPYIVSKGFNGVFLDNLDIVDDYPWMRSCIVELVKEIRERYPNLKIMVNRGLHTTRQHRLCAIRGFLTYYNWTSHKYSFFTGRDLKWIEQQLAKLKRLSREYGLKVILLSYANPKTRE